MALDVLHRITEGFLENFNRGARRYLGYIECLNGNQCNIFKLSMQKYIYLQIIMDLPVICGIVELFKINFHFFSIFRPFVTNFDTKQLSHHLYLDEIGFNM